jgi:hypothetical protein
MEVIGMVTAAHAATWEECIDTFQMLCNALTERQGPAEFWFRGHAKACWKLETTLERYSTRSFSFKEYYKIILKILPEVEGLSSHESQVMSCAEFSSGVEDFAFHTKFPSSDYFSYLRHFGFPSPLLDWSKSLYVAAYFAFADPVTDGKNAAIYLFADRFGPTKEFVEGDPMIWLLGPYTKIHKRHYRQQSGYTICGCFDMDEFDKVKRWRFASHDLVTANAVPRRLQQKPQQDYLMKITIPVSERTKVLRYLDKHNLNAFSLFDTEEGLLKTLAFRGVPVS